MKTNHQVCQRLQMYFKHSTFTQFKSLGSQLVICILMILACKLKSLKMTIKVGKKAH